MIERFAAILSAMTLCLLSASVIKAGEASHVTRIGILIPESGPAESQTIKGLKEGLRDLGYIEGQNLVVELRDVKGDRSALKAAATDLVNKKIDMILTTGTRATQAAEAATKKIPIVFLHPADPVAMGFLKNLKRPEGNVTGVAAFSAEMSQKRLEILQILVPNLRRVHIFYDENNKYSGNNFLAAQKAAAKLRLEVADHPVKTANELKSVLEQMQVRDGDAILQIADDLVESQGTFLLDRAKALKLATLFNAESWISKGSLATYGPDYTHMGRHAAQLVDKLLKGAPPKDVPVQSASKFDLLINLRTATAIGLNIAPEALNKADKVIR
jgi:putative tryptophan/tyrosine transport system substrate-binding protein